MRLKLSKFCALSTSSVWQSWLYNYNDLIYRKFIARLRESSGCTRNKEIMEETLIDIKQHGGENQLFEFLQNKFPETIVDRTSQITDGGNVFIGYVPGIVTYPRRHIIKSNNISIDVEKFVKDKGHFDYVIIGDTAYIEYLLKTENQLYSQISSNNWQIKKWREKNE